MNKHTERHKKICLKLTLISFWNYCVKPLIRRRPRQGLTSEILQKIKLVFGENVMESSIDTALLLIFSSQSETMSVRNMYIRNIGSRIEKKEMALKWHFRSFVHPGNSFQKFTLTNSKNIQTKYIELCLSAISLSACNGVFVFQTFELKFGLSIEKFLKKDCRCHKF